MLTKERLAELFQGLARIFPGIPSYQEREGLRAQDKIIRSQLARRILEEAAHIDQLKADLVNRAILLPLANLDRLCRKLQRLSDSIRFARYGYAGLFADVQVNEQKLMELYDYDLSLSQNIEELAAAVNTLKERSYPEWQNGSLQAIQEIVDGLEERIAKREPLFAG